MYIIIIISISMTTTIIIITIKQAEECDMFNQLMESGYGTAEEVVLYFIFTYYCILLLLYFIFTCIIVYYCPGMGLCAGMRGRWDWTSVCLMYNVHCICCLASRLYCTAITLHPVCIGALLACRHI